MNRIEDLVRDSLRQRAGDVRATPALWREVDRRIVRRRRFQVMSWSLAAAAAALAAFAVLPGLLDGADPVPEIDNAVPRTGVVPSTAVVADGGELSLVDLTGERAPTVLFEGEGEIVQVEVRPGSSAETYDVAAVRRGGPDAEDGGAELLLASSVDGARSAVEGRLPEHAEDPAFVPSIGWAPEGEQLLYTIPGEANGVVLVAEQVSRDETFLDPDRGSALADIADGVRILDWIGATAEPSDASLVLLRRADGEILSVEVTAADDGTLVAGSVGAQPMRVEGAFDVAGAHSTPSVRSAEQYLLARDRDGEPSFVWVGGDGDEPEVVELELAEALGVDVAAEDLWLAAKQDAALVGDGERLWLLAHDGGGGFGPAVELPAGGSLGALFDAPRPGGDQDAEEPAPEDDTEPEPAPDPGPAPSDDPSTDETSDEGSAVDVDLPEPAVTISWDELTLHGPDGPEVLARLLPEGESRFVSARVRPGSTIDDLTVVALTTAEGMYDLRHLHYVDGEVVTWEPFDPPYRPGSGDGAEAGASALGPVWSPDGDHLAWLEFGAGEPALQVIGWDEGPGTGDRATDNTSFGLDDLGVTPIIPMEWVEIPGTAGMTEIRAAWADFTEGWFAIPLEIQGDGAVAIPAGGPNVVTRPGPAGAGGTTAAVAGTGGAEGVDWMVVSTFEGADLLRDPYGAAERIELPAELQPGDGIPEYFLSPIGAGVIVGSPGTATAYLVTEDGEPVRLGTEVVGVDVVR